MKNISVASFLKNGDIVRTKKSGFEKWNTNIAFEVKDDVLVLDAGINEEYFKYINKGDEIECKVTQDNFEYAMKGYVDEISTSPIHLMTLRLESIKRYDNIRKDSRHFVHLFALIKKDKYDKDAIFAVVTDISKSGVKALVNKRKGIHENAIGEVLNFEISLEDQRTISFEGLIKREQKSGSGVEYGVELKSIDDASDAILNEYVDELEKTDKEFQQLKQEIWEYNFEM